MVVSMSLILEVLKTRTTTIKKTRTVSVNRMLCIPAYLVVDGEQGNVVLNPSVTRPCFRPHLGISSVEKKLSMQPCIL